LIEELTRRGVQPVISHPERHPEFTRRPGLLSQWAQVGCMFQITAGSLVGRFGEMPRRMSRILLDDGLADIVASDAHAPTGRRRPLLAAAFGLLADIYGEGAARDLMVTTPARLAGVSRASEQHPAVESG
jgi:protein-tyrosine phosphatase